MFNIKVILPALTGKQYSGRVIQFDNLVKYKE